MKTQNLLFFPFLFALGIGLFSCNIGNNGNVQTFQNIPAVATYNYDLMGIMLGTPYGYIAMPELNAMPGDCLLLNQYTIDYDNQPSTQYYTATNVDVDKNIGQSYIEQNDTVLINNSTLPLTGVSVYATSPYFEGKFFVSTACNDNNPTFRLVYNNTKDEANGVKNLYLLAQPSGTGSSTVGFYQALDVSTLTMRDTTVSGVNLQYVTVKLNYLSAISDTGVPTYTGVSQNPFTIYIFQNQ